jgi:two-component system, chemotaxis family, chemotaxis protein CheY
MLVASLDSGVSMPETTATPRPCRVMLIEDDLDDVFLFERALDRVRAGMRREIALEYAGDGLDAAYRVSIDDLMTRLPDVVVLDLNMPRLDGVKFLHALRGNFEIHDLPVVVLTTSTERPIHDEALRAGADKVFVKPDSAGALTAIAADIVERGLSHAQPETLPDAGQYSPPRRH